MSDDAGQPPDVADAGSPRGDGLRAALQSPALFSGGAIVPPTQTCVGSRTEGIGAVVAANDGTTAASNLSAGDEEAELFFLIADFLKRRSSCQRAADVLIDELSSNQLLGEGVDWRGTNKVATYEDFRLRHRDLGPRHLLDLLRSVTAREGGQDETKDAPASSTPSLLLKSRVDQTTRMILTEDERKDLAKEIVNQLFELRRNAKTQAVVQKVIKKYERLQQYINVANPNLLPDDLLAELLSDDGGADKVTSLAADARALKQLFQLRESEEGMRKNMRALFDRASRAQVFKTAARAGRNQMSLLRRREVNSSRVHSLPPAYVYSRIRRLKTLNGHLQIQTYCLTYDKTGKFVITGADDRLIKIWSLETGDLKFTLRGHVGNITDLAVNSANTLLASSSDDKTVRVWELTTGAPVAVLLGHSSIVNSVRFHPKKNVVVTASDDGRSFCYILPEIPRVDEVETKLQTAKRLFSLNAYLLSLHPMYSLSHGVRQGSRSCKVLCLSFSRCGKYVLTGGEDGVARVWDMSILSDPHAPAVVPRFQPTDEPGERILDPSNVLDPELAIPPLNVNPDLVNNQTTEALRLQAATGPMPVQGGQDTELGIALPLQVTPATAQLADRRQGQLESLGAAQIPGLADPTGLINPVMQDPNLAGPLDGAVQPGGPVVQDPRLMEPGADPAIQVMTPADAPQPSQPPQLPQNDNPSISIADSDVPRLPNSEPIALLKGHTGPITNIIYNHAGDQVATASIKDGSTRIWKVTKNYQRMKSIVLEPEELDDRDALARLYGVHSRKRARPAVDTLMWTRDDRRLITLHSVKPATHSVDGDWRQRIKVWNPWNGKLVMNLGAVDIEKKNGHINAVFAMDVHPTDWRIVVTAGYDGRVFLWDISTGRMLKSFVNTSPESKLVPMLDGGFRPDGNGFCFTDQIGRLLIFGTGSGEQYAAAPVQQYFRRDYAVLITDRHMNVRDRETQQLPSLMEPGPVVDIYRIEYPHQPPHLLPNSENLTLEEYAENRRQRVEQSKESEIKCRVRHLPEDDIEIESFPLAICSSTPKQTSDEAGEALAIDPIVNSSFRLNGAPVTLSELRRRPHLAGSRHFGQLRRRRSSASLEERDTSILEMEISSDDDHSDEDFQAPAPNADAEEGEEEDDEDEDEDEEMDEDDLLSDNDDAVISPSNFRRRRLRSFRQAARQATPSRRFPTRGGRRLNDTAGANGTRRLRGRRSHWAGDASEGAIPTERPIGEDGDDDMSGDVQSHSSPERQMGGDGVVVESNDGFIMGDNQLDKFDLSITYEEMLQSKREQSGTTGDTVVTENGEEALIPCAFCNVGDDGVLLKLPGDSMGVHPLINGSQRLFVHDQCAIASPLCFNRNGNWYNVTKEIRRGRSLACVECKKRGATVGCAIPSCPKSYHWKCAVNCGWSMNQIQFYCPTHEAQRSNGSRRQDGGSPVSSDSGDEDTVAKRFGLAFHREWLQLVSLSSIHQYVPQVGDYIVYFPEGHLAYMRYCEMRHPSYFSRLRNFFAVKCRVLDVAYKFPLVESYAKSSTIKCEISLAVLAVPTSQVAQLSTTDQETKTEEEGEMQVDPDVFNPDESPFSKFTGVDQTLRPTDAGSTAARFQFKMVYYSNDVANFLVADHVYDNGVRAGWKVGDRVQMPYVQLDAFGLETGSKMSTGVIESIAPKAFGEDERTTSPWDCVTVDWDSEEDDTCAVCPWELEPATPEALAEKRQRELRRPSTRLYLSRLIVADKRDVLAQVVDQMMTLSISRDFIYPVDESFLDYLITVPNPIDLTKIRQRLRHGYYRQVEAFIADAKLLYVNCETYNIQSSSIAQNSRSLYSSLLTEASRYFPHLMQTPEPTADQSIQLVYPPDDFITTFPNEPEDAEIGHLTVGTSESTYEEPDTSDVVAPTTTSPVGPGVSDVTPEVEPPTTRTLRHHVGSVGMSTTHPSPVRTDALATPERPRTRSGALSPTPSHASPDTRLTPSRSRRTARAASTTVAATAPKATDDGGSGRKRQRGGQEREIVQYDGILQKMTTTQREAFIRACDDDLESVLQDFHEALMQADEMDVFGAPVTEEIAPQYFEIIVTPMDFGTMLDQLSQYATFREYYDDLHLVFSNAITYNTWESPIGELVAELQKYTVKFLLDASGADRHHGAAASGAQRRGHRPAVDSAQSSPLTKPAANNLGKRRARNHSIISDDEANEGSWGSDFSESDDGDDDDDDDDEEEEDASDEDDEPWASSSRGRSRRAPTGRSRGRPSKFKNGKRQRR